MQPVEKMRGGMGPKLSNLSTIVEDSSAEDFKGRVDPGLVRILVAEDIVRAELIDAQFAEGEGFFSVPNLHDKHGRLWFVHD